jgi:hypothetical protein
VEFGYALANGLPVVVIGPRENVFYNLQEVWQVEDFDLFCQCFRSRQNAGGGFYDQRFGRRS